MCKRREALSLAVLIGRGLDQRVNWESASDLQQPQPLLHLLFSSLSLFGFQGAETVEKSGQRRMSLPFCF